MREKWFRTKVGRVSDVCMLSNNYVPHMTGPHSLCLLIQPYICFPWSLLCLLLISKVPHLDDDVEAHRLCRVVVASFSYYWHGDHGDLHMHCQVSPSFSWLCIFCDAWFNSLDSTLVNLVSCQSNWPPKQSTMGTLQHNSWCGACWDRKHCQKRAMLWEEDCVQDTNPSSAICWSTEGSYLVEWQAVTVQRNALRVSCLTREQGDWTCVHESSKRPITGEYCCGCWDFRGSRKGISQWRWHNRSERFQAGEDGDTLHSKCLVNEVHNVMLNHHQWVFNSIEALWQLMTSDRQAVLPKLTKKGGTPKNFINLCQHEP